MRVPVCVVLIVLCTFSCAHGQIAAKDKRSPELFTSYFGVTTPTVKAHIPTETCRAIIAQADKIVGSSEGLKSVERHDLQVASVNLRTCATSELARIERDLAVGLYGEVVSEVERRERDGN
jgi:hypothetical protein